MGTMKQIVTHIEDLIDNGYDDEAIALIVGVDATVVKQVKKNLGVQEDTTKDDLENY